MDLVAEQLATHLSHVDGVQAELVRYPLRFARTGGVRGLERALGRFVQLPLELAVRRPSSDFFHIADHSYGHLALLFPRDRVGVYCHDIDAFRALLPGSRSSRARAALSALLLRGLRHARFVFHSTSAVKAEILEHRLVPASRLIQVPLGVADEFLGPIEAHTEYGRYLLHVGSCTPRKNVDFLLQLFAHARAHHPGLRLVQVGGRWTDAQRVFLESRALLPAVTQVRDIPRTELASLYARALAVLVPSLAEGFGLPVIEAVACGAPVVASDLPVLREVGLEGVEFARVNDTAAWLAAIAGLAEGQSQADHKARDRVRAAYSWDAHAREIARAYATRAP